MRLIKLSCDRHYIHLFIDSLDYETLNQDLILIGPALQMTCTSFSVIRDGRIEGTERLFISLTSEDRAVNITLNQADVEITESDGM